jgi:phosphonate transport system substrate-binding protein
MYLDRSRGHRIARRVLTLAFALALAGGTVEAADTFHFAVGPLQPTPSETKKAFDPFFKHLAEQLGGAYTLEATTDWAGIAVALASGQVDVAWMGPGAT